MQASVLAIGLDPRERIRFRNLLSKLAKGRVVLFSTHVVEDVAVSCERVVVLMSGRLVYDGMPEHLADYAQGKVWEVDVSEEDADEMERQYRIITQIPNEDGSVRLRLLAKDKPALHARQAEPNLEDGYLQLLYGEQAA